MKNVALALMAAWGWFAVNQMSYQDAIRTERAKCISGIELQIEMPDYCDKYQNQTGESQWKM